MAAPEPPVWAGYDPADVEVGMRFAILGSGAVGGYFGARLLRAIPAWGAIAATLFPLLLAWGLALAR